MQIALKIIVSMLMKFASEKFFSRMLCIGLRAVSEKTTNTVDDRICKAVEDALGNP